MKKLNYLALITIVFFTITITNAQDKIYLTSGDNIEVKVLEIGVNVIKYKKTENIEGPTYSLDKNEIQLLLYANGSSDIFTKTNPKPITKNENSLSNSENRTKKELEEIEKVKGYIIENINKYCSSQKGSNPYEASFEGDFLRIRETNDRRTKFIYDMGLFDLTNAIKFEEISFRGNQKAYLNIWVLNKQKHSWKNNKLVIRVMGHKNAEGLHKAFLEYNQLISKS